MTKQEARKEWEENKYFEASGVYVETQADAISNWGAEAREEGVNLEEYQIWVSTDNGAAIEGFNTFEEVIAYLPDGFFKG